jgi:hypothetical protein
MSREFLLHAEAKDWSLDSVVQNMEPNQSGIQIAVRVGGFLRRH